MFLYLYNNLYYLLVGSGEKYFFTSQFLKHKDVFGPIKHNNLTHSNLIIQYNVVLYKYNFNRKNTRNGSEK